MEEWKQIEGYNYQVSSLGNIKSLNYRMTGKPQNLKPYINKQSGERMTVEAVKRVKEWFWISDSGKINLAIKYGAKTLSLNKKGANAIEIANGEELINTLIDLKSATLNGELDDAINEISTATRLAFNK